VKLFNQTYANPRALASRLSYPATMAPSIIKNAEIETRLSGYLPNNPNYTIIVANIAHLPYVNNSGILQNLAAYNPKSTPIKFITAIAGPILNLLTWVT
jgi:hypothetical protein